jgi:hypothetical protein
MFSGCNREGYGTLGLAYVDVICSDYGVGVSEIWHWSYDAGGGGARLGSNFLTFTHELGHNLGGEHAFETVNGVISKHFGGIMDYGNSIEINGITQFNTKMNQDSMCAGIAVAVGRCPVDAFHIWQEKTNVAWTEPIPISDACNSAFRMKVPVRHPKRKTGHECANDPCKWSDGYGDTCNNYEEENYCADGEPASGWGWSLDDPDLLDAKEHCCSCGGGKIFTTTTTTTTKCRDMKDWGISTQQANGEVAKETCWHYKKNKWCKADGTEGSKWDYKKWGSIVQWMNDKHIHAAQACCACGGGSQRETTETVTLPGCVDSPGWKNMWGDTCARFAAQEWCTHDGTAFTEGNGWRHTKWGSINQYTDQHGIDATLACCVCGGNKEKAHIKETDFENCQDDPEDWKWVDKFTRKHETCHTYVRENYCTVGGKGSGWNDMQWGNIADWKNDDDIDAGQACCACGGGKQK